MNTQQQLYVAQKFVSRAQSFQLKRGTQAYKKAQEHFIAGAMAAWCASIQVSDLSEEKKQEWFGKAMPPMWVFGLMRGDDVVQETISEWEKSLSK